ncbi:MAG: hypothetical protein K8J31_17555 [Anaerolineae bacterium]|nr:hypothetical protein [Anaerolineae bacterium]
MAELFFQPDAPGGVGGLIFLHRIIDAQVQAEEFLIGLRMEQVFHIRQGKHKVSFRSGKSLP